MKKTCTSCSIEKDLSSFRRDKSKHGGYAARCKECARVAIKSQYSQKYSDAARESSRNRREEAMCLIASYKQDASCIFCGEDEVSCLEFHHTDPTTKEFTIGQSAMLSKKRIVAEIKKCVILCCNCHRKLHAGMISLVL